MGQWVGLGEVTVSLKKYLTWAGATFAVDPLQKFPRGIGRAMRSASGGPAPSGSSLDQSVNTP
jgi:hypothetical protein